MKTEDRLMGTTRNASRIPNYVKSIKNSNMKEAEIWNEFQGQLGSANSDTSRSMESMSEPTTPEELVEWINRHVSEYGRISASKQFLLTRYMHKIVDQAWNAALDAAARLTEKSLDGCVDETQLISLRK